MIFLPQILQLPESQTSKTIRHLRGSPRHSRHWNSPTDQPLLGLWVLGETLSSNFLQYLLQRLYYPAI